MFIQVSDVDILVYQFLDDTWNKGKQIAAINREINIVMLLLFVAGDGVCGAGDDDVIVGDGYTATGDDDDDDVDVIDDDRSGD